MLNDTQPLSQGRGGICNKAMQAHGTFPNGSLFVPDPFQKPAFVRLRSERRGMRKPLHGRVEGVDAGQRLAGARCGPQCLEHDQRIGETGALLRSGIHSLNGTFVRLQRAPDDLIVLDTNVLSIYNILLYR